MKKEKVAKGRIIGLVGPCCMGKTSKSIFGVICSSSYTLLFPQLIVYILKKKYTFQVKK